MNAPSTRPRFSFQIRHDGQNTIFYISGVMDQEGGMEMKEELQKSLNESQAIVFHLGETRIISSGGLSVLVDIARLLQTNNIPFRVTQPSEMVLRTLKVVHIDKLITIQ